MFVDSLARQRSVRWAADWTSHNFFARSDISAQSSIFHHASAFTGKDRLPVWTYNLFFKVCVCVCVCKRNSWLLTAIIPKSAKKSAKKTLSAVAGKWFGNIGAYLASIFALINEGVPTVLFFNRIIWRWIFVELTNCLDRQYHERTAHIFTAADRIS